MKLGKMLSIGASLIAGAWTYGISATYLLCPTLPTSEPHYRFPTTSALIHTTGEKSRLEDLVTHLMETNTSIETIFMYSQNGTKENENRLRSLYESAASKLSQTMPKPTLRFVSFEGTLPPNNQSLTTTAEAIGIMNLALESSCKQNIPPPTVYFVTDDRQKWDLSDAEGVSRFWNTGCTASFYHVTSRRFYGTSRNDEFPAIHAKTIFRFAFSLPGKVPLVDWIYGFRHSNDSLALTDASRVQKTPLSQ